MHTTLSECEHVVDLAVLFIFYIIFIHSVSQSVTPVTGLHTRYLGGDSPALAPFPPTGIGKDMDGNRNY